MDAPENTRGGESTTNVLHVSRTEVILTVRFGTIHSCFNLYYGYNVPCMSQNGVTYLLTNTYGADYSSSLIDSRFQSTNFQDECCRKIRVDKAPRQDCCAVFVSAGSGLSITREDKDV